MIDIKTLSGELSSEYGCSDKIEPVPNADFKEDVADATAKYFVELPSGENGFLLVSGDANPRLIGRAVDNISLARNALTAQTAAHVLPASLTGTIEGLDFAIWPLKNTFQAHGRIQRKLRSHLFAKRLVNWAHAFQQETLSDGQAEDFDHDLQGIIEEHRFPKDMRADAAIAQKRLAASSWKPKHCYQHSDYWTENILLPTSSAEPDFYVIDWAGMCARGYPFMDVTRMIMSLRLGQRFNRRSIAMIRQSIMCEEQDVISYALSAYGQLGRNLEYFPPDRYRETAIGTYQFLKHL